MDRILLVLCPWRANGVLCCCVDEQDRAYGVWMDVDNWRDHPVPKTWPMLVDYERSLVCAAQENIERLRWQKKAAEHHRISKKEMDKLVMANFGESAMESICLPMPRIDSISRRTIERMACLPTCRR